MQFPIFGQLSGIATFADLTEGDHFVLSNIPDFFCISIIIIEFIMNISSEFQGFYSLEYVILLTIAL